MTFNEQTHAAWVKDHGIFDPEGEIKAAENKAMNKNLDTHYDAALGKMVKNDKAWNVDEWYEKNKIDTKNPIDKLKGKNDKLFSEFDKAGLGSQSDKVTGTKQVTINVSINKLVEMVKIEARNIKEGVNSAAPDVAKALLSAVNQFSASTDI